MDPTSKHTDPHEAPPRRQRQPTLQHTQEAPGTGSHHQPPHPFMYPPTYPRMHASFHTHPCTGNHAPSPTCHGVGTEARGASCCRRVATSSTASATSAKSFRSGMKGPAVAALVTVVDQPGDGNCPWPAPSPPVPPPAGAPHGPLPPGTTPASRESWVDQRAAGGHELRWRCGLRVLPTDD
jgi:hypothetical protein